MHDVSDAAVRAIAERLDDVRERIARACRRAGRRSEDVTLVGVTKTFPAETVAAAYAAGLRDFGENKVQELTDKAAAWPGTVEGGTLRWHMIGHLQRNKARDVVACADLFHALDSRRLAVELDRRAAQAGRVLPCLVQVNVSDEESKFGFDPGAVPAFLDGIAGLDHVRIVGLMTLAAPAADPETVRPQFQRLRRVLDDARRAGRPHAATMRMLSMGMSGDFEVAVEEGATHVRLGTVLFGAREIRERLG